MKKLNNLTSIFAIVLALSVMSCGDTDEPKPVNPVDEITLSDFDGNWRTTSVNGIDASNACNEVNFNWGVLGLNIMSSSKQIQFTDLCDGDVRTWDVSFNNETLVITVTGSFSQELQITDYNLQTTPFTATVKVIKQGGGFTTGVTYNLEKI